MNIKKCFRALSGIMLLTAFSSSFAMGAPCPSANDLRDAGSKFSYAYNTEKNNWVLISDAFNLNETNWQTIFTVYLPYALDPEMALEMGQSFYNKSPLLAEPASISSVNKTECLYTTTDVNYKVIAVSPVRFGIKSAK